MFEHSNFHEAIFFDDVAFGTATGTSAPIANPKQAALRVVGYFADGVTGTGTDAKTVSVSIQGAAKPDATGTAWQVIESGTFSGTGTAFGGEFFNKVVDSDANYIRAVVASANLDGKMSVAAEYIPR